jgi:zinc transport system substrate-binding protein
MQPSCNKIISKYFPKREALMKHFWTLILSVVLWNGAFARNTPSVVVTTYPLYEVMKQVGGNTIRLEQVIPHGRDIHTFRPSPKTMVAVSRASLFIHSGAGLEPWNEQLLMSLPSGTEAVDMSRHVTLLEHQEEGAVEGHEHGREEEQGHEGHHEHGEEKEHEHHHHGPVDPHYWLDISNMIAMTEAARQLLSELQPQQKDAYRRNAEAFAKELAQLDAAYRKALAACDRHYLVSNHDAFGYLGHAYGFETIAVTGLSPDHQPSAKVMAEVMKLVKTKKIRIVFFEAFVSDSVARALAEETGATVSSLQPLANLSGDEAASNENYITIMYKNLEKIVQALECH